MADDHEVRITANFEVAGDDYVELLADARATAYRLLGEGRVRYYLTLVDAKPEPDSTRWKAMAHLSYPDDPEF